jgi:ABC-type cobalt transport system, permease component CbiQ and related transporters
VTPRKAEDVYTLLEAARIFHREYSKTPIVAISMEARCYRGGEHRTRMNAMHYGKSDALVFVLTALFVGLCVLERMYI